jgi:integrase
MSPKPLARVRADGGTTYQVKWRLGGSRTGAWASESFTDDRKALRFCLDVEDAGMEWPEGWVKGVGRVDDEPEPEPAVTFNDVVAAYWRVQERRMKRGHIKPYTLQRDKRTVELHMENLAGRDFTTITTDDINDWVDAQLDAGAAAKSIRNRHGLLSPVMDHGAYQMHLRADNPCRFTDLPAVSAKSRRQVRFFQHDEWALMRACLKPDVHLLVETLLASGLRWGEVTALRVGDVQVKGDDELVLHVQRAWSQRAKDDPAIIDTAAGETKAWVLGPPKADSRRFVPITGQVARDVAASVNGRPHDEYVFHGRSGTPWRYPDFHENRWAGAASDAKARGLMKTPTIHMLRHTFVVWSLDAGVPIERISMLLGHSSIQITHDIYGGLVNLHDPSAARAMARQMLSVPTNLENAPTAEEVATRPGRAARRAAKATGAS